MYRLFFVEFEMMKSFHKRPGVDDDDNDGDGDVIVRPSVTSRGLDSGDVACRLSHAGRKILLDRLDGVRNGSPTRSTSSLTVSRCYLDGVITRLGRCSFTGSILMKFVPVCL